MTKLNDIIKVRLVVRENKPLIHAITNPIAMNMLANAILFQGASPICAQDPREMEDIVPKADSLSINLGNITEERLQAMEIAVRIANRENIPVIIDLVGVGISSLRLDFSKKLLAEYHFDLIKGNSSEILALGGERSHAKGVDVGEADKIGQDTISDLTTLAKEISKKYKTQVLITGETDILASEKTYYHIKNGTDKLGSLTATGCMLTGLISTFLAVTNPIAATILALLIEEISAEDARSDKPYGFFVDLMDNIGNIDDETLIKKAKIEWETYE